MKSEEVVICRECKEIIPIRNMKILGHGYRYEKEYRCSCTNLILM